MSIAEEISKLQTNINEAYSSIGNKGGTVPEHKTAHGLAGAVNSIPAGGGVKPKLKYYKYESFPFPISGTGQDSGDIIFSLPDIESLKKYLEMEMHFSRLMAYVNIYSSENITLTCSFAIRTYVGGAWEFGYFYDNGMGDRSFQSILSGENYAEFVSKTGITCSDEFASAGTYQETEVFMFAQCAISDLVESPLIEYEVIPYLNNLNPAWGVLDGGKRLIVKPQLVTYLELGETTFYSGQYGDDFRFLRQLKLLGDVTWEHGAFGLKTVSGTLAPVLERIDLQSYHMYNNTGVSNPLQILSFFSNIPGSTNLREIPVYGTHAAEFVSTWTNTARKRKFIVGV